MEKPATVNKRLMALAAAFILSPLAGCNKNAGTEPPRADAIKGCTRNFIAAGSKTLNVAVAYEDYSSTIRSVMVELSDKTGLKKLAPSLGLTAGDAEPVIVSRRFTYFPQRSEKPEYQVTEKTDKGQLYSSDYSNRLSADARQEGDTIYARCVRGYNATPSVKPAP